MIKRIFDIAVSALALLLGSPLFILIAALVKLDSKGPVFFSQQRVGKNFRPFWIYKFRSMIEDAPRQGGPITFGEDARITRVGRFLRKTKFDELPQLINVLKGDMSLVGPRPEVPTYVQLFKTDYEEILQVHPGITDLASLKYRNEAATLQQSENPEETYRTIILPDKIRLAKEYLLNASIHYDLKLVLKTIFGTFVGPKLR